MAERFEIMEKALLQMLESKKYATLRDMLITMNPSDVAGIFNDLEEKQVPLMFRLLPKELAAETFVEMEPDTQALLIQGFSDNFMWTTRPTWWRKCLPPWCAAFWSRLTPKCAAPSIRSSATPKTPRAPS